MFNGNGGAYDDPYHDSDNHDTHYFEPLRPGGDARWRNAAARIAEVDAEYRVRRGGDWGLEEPADGFASKELQRMVIAARHLVSMLQNGIEYGGASNSERVQSVYRRLRFEHHGLLFRFALLVLRQDLGEEWVIPGGNDAYEEVSHYCRRLTFQDSAVPLLLNSRRADWRCLLNVVEDQLNVQWPAPYLASTPRDSGDHQRAIWSRALLEPVRAMLQVFESNFEHQRSLWQIVLLRNHLRTLQASLRSFASQEHGIDGFRSLGEEQVALYEIADLFANRLLEDDDSTEEVWGRDDAGIFQFEVTWAEQLQTAIAREAANLNLLHPHMAPGRTPELYRTLTPFAVALGNVLNQPDGMTGISDRSLESLRRRIGPYIDESVSADGVEFRNINTGNGPLKPHFLRMVEAMEMILEEPGNIDGDRATSARSSQSTNADNVLEDDVQLIDSDLQTMLRRAVNSEREFRETAPDMNMTIDVLERLSRLGRRLRNRPHERNGPIQEDFDHLHVLDVDRQAGRGLQWDWGTNSLREAHTARIMHRMVKRAAENPSTNPDGAARRRDLETVMGHLREPDILLAGASDAAYLEALRQQLRVDDELWQRGRLQTRTGDALDAWLTRLCKLVFDRMRAHGLPEALRGERLALDIREGQDAVREFDHTSTLVGALEFERLMRIRQAVLEPIGEGGGGGGGV